MSNKPDTIRLDLLLCSQSVIVGKLTKCKFCAQCSCLYILQYLHDLSQKLVSLGQLKLKLL